MKRFVAFDVIRGVGLMGVVFLHSALYHYANLLEIDFADPPLVVTVIGMLLMWAGLFAIVSGAVHSIRAVQRRDAGASPTEIGRGLAASGLVILVSAYVYFPLLGPAILDRVHGNHDYSFVDGLLATGRAALPSLERMVYVDALVMIGLNLLFMAPLVAWASGEGVGRKRKSVAAMLGTLVVLLSWARIGLYPIVETAIVERDWPLIAALNFLANKNNPLLPYLGFGFVGVALGLTVARAKAWRDIWPRLSALGLVWLAAGVVGLANLPDTMLERAVDEMWFFIIVAQVGIFLLIALGSLRYFDFAPRERAARRSRAFAFARRFGVVAITVFVLETPVSRIAGLAMEAISPGWNQTMSATILFATAMTVAWGVALYFWERVDYRFSIDRFLIRGLEALGKHSSKSESLSAGTPDPAVA